MIAESWRVINGITLGNVISIFYDSHSDIIIIKEDKGNSRGIIQHTFGPQAEELEDLLLLLEEYVDNSYQDKKKTFKKIRERISKK